MEPGIIGKIKNFSKISLPIIFYYKAISIYISMSYIKTTDDFRTWYESKSPTLNTNMKNIYINDNDKKPEWIFWFYYTHGGIMDLKIVCIMNIYSDDKDEIINNIINDRDLKYRYRNSYYETYIYIYICWQEYP